MDFSSALGYPFRGSNIPKILTIAIVFVIIGVSLFVGAMLLESAAMMYLLIPVLLAYGFFISGYTISVIRSVVDGYADMPSFELGRNLWRGFMVFLATFVYMIPIAIVFMLILFMTGASIDSSAQFNEPSSSGMLMFCGGSLVAAVLSFAIGYSLIVGQVRYAIEDSAGALFNIGKNFGIVMSNFGTTLSLLIHQIGLLIVFAIISSIISSIISAPFTNVMRDLAFVNDPNDLVRLGMPLAMFFSLYYVVSLTINLMQTFSSAYLMAGYGIDLGLAGKSKYKNDDHYDF